MDGRERESERWMVERNKRALPADSSHTALLQLLITNKSDEENYSEQNLNTFCGKHCLSPFCTCIWWMDNVKFFVIYTHSQQPAIKLCDMHIYWMFSWDANEKKMGKLEEEKFSRIYSFRRFLGNRSQQGGHCKLQNKLLSGFFSLLTTGSIPRVYFILMI